MEITAFKDIHKGERCFIIGTGPSLNKTNLSLIKDEIIFGVNTLYRGLPRFGITCRYYGVCDLAMWQENYKELLEIDTTLFLTGLPGIDYLTHQERYQFGRTPVVIKQHSNWANSKGFSKDLSEGLYEGSTVIKDGCLQVAYYMGFSQVYLVGCDCEHWESHFDGSRGKVDTVGAVFDAYQVCKEAYEKDGREIINATVGGKLELFRREKLSLQLVQKGGISKRIGTLSL